MVAIMKHLYQYAPLVEKCTDQYIPSIDETVKIWTGSSYPILFGGDQLTPARARGAKKAEVNSISPCARLEGLVPVAEDWHVKVSLLKVSRLDLCHFLQNIMV